MAGGSPAGGATEFRVLGSVEALRDGRSLPLGGPRQRAMLALLLLEPGRAVPDDRLADELWHGEPPPGAATTLRVYVSRLRSVLPDAAIARNGTGYALDVLPERVDSHRFELLLAAGRESLARGAAQRAASRLAEALELWRGKPYGALADEGALALEAKRLEDLRVLAVEERIEAELRLGRDAELVDELEALLAEHRYRERLWHHLMLALYRAGRQADALAAYHRARTILDEDLGLEPSEALRGLEQAILNHEVPSARPPEERHNLPAPVTSFIGRAPELADIERLLGETRLLTLTGVGGAGKTRLALEAAGRALADFPDGVFFVDFSGLTDARFVSRDVARALGIAESTDVDVADLVLGELRAANVLLVLDNCERVRDGCAELARRLLSASPALRILATSRELLGAPGEVDYAVPPLSLPSREADEHEVRTSEAVRLFLTRARAVRPSLSDDARSIATAAGICADLDGLPLAIELAAARAKALTLEEIAGRLGDRFRFLVAWRRLAPARHRTLKEAMDWSYELLDPDEQSFLAQLSVFAGDFTLDAAATVCLQRDGESALALIERLIAASLVVANERDGEMRYRLLETVRQYATEQLDAETAEQTRRAHADYFLEVAENAHLTSLRFQGERVEVATAAQDNLRSALARSVATGAVAFGLELATALERFWVTRDPREGMRWFSALFVQPEIDSVTPEIRANALRAYGSAADIAGAHAEAERLWEQSLALFEELGDRRGRAVLLHRLAVSALRRGDHARARELAESSHQIHESMGYRWGMAQTMGTLGAIARDSGDERLAYELIEATEATAREAGVRWWVSGTLAELANLSLNAGRIDEGENQAREALTIAEEMGDRPGRVFSIGLLARVAAARGQRERAARLWAAVENEDAGAPLGGWRRHRASYAALMREFLDGAPLATSDVLPPTLDAAASLALEDSGA